ncbi:alpha/beta fold hydrolase [Rhodobacterales bacterium HKCCE3408]|nr:alpha/beta fold hydrolase [Rhodobacterales bacterium HKCCE3408]
MSWLTLSLAVLALAALSLFGGVWAFQRYAVYRFPEGTETAASVGIDGLRIVDYAAGDGTTGRAWVVDPAEGQPVLLAFHGNSSSVGRTLPQLRGLIDRGYGVVMMQYRGAGGLPGRPAEMAFAADAAALYDQLDTILSRPVPVSQRVLYGYSLGGGVGSRLAASRDFAGVILLATPYRTCRFYTKRARGLPMCNLMWAERYDVVDHVRPLHSPLLVIHGTDDDVVPIEDARELYAEAPNPHAFVELPAGHGDLFRAGATEAIVEFVEAVTD